MGIDSSLKRKVSKMKKELAMAAEQATVNIKRGDGFIIPHGMDLPRAGKMLIDAGEALKQKNDVAHLVSGHPLDALVAVNRALYEVFDIANATTRVVNTFFGPQSQAPDTIRVKTGPGDREYVDVIQGSFSVPGIDEVVTVQTTRQGAFISGSVDAVEKEIFMRLCATADRLVREKSIFRGKAIRIPGRDKLYVNETEFLVGHLNTPDLDGYTLNPSEYLLLDSAILSVIRNTDAARENGIKIRGGAILHGAFGTGKTLTATLVARECVENGWTFIAIDGPKVMQGAIDLARILAPAVLFCEDVDFGFHDREATNHILEAIDGINAKDQDVLLMMTTNHLDRIDPAFVRPGRVDVIIKLSEFGEEAASAFLEKFLPERQRAFSVAEATSHVVGLTGAAASGMIRLAKQFAFTRGDRKVKLADIVAASEALRNQWDLAYGVKDATETPASRLYGAMGDVATVAVREQIPAIAEAVADLI